MLQELILSIGKQVDIDVTKYEPVTGGDINQSFCLHTNDSKFFLKVNEADRFPEMFAREADGLEALRHSGQLIVPQVMQSGEHANKQWLLLQWIDKGAANKNSMRDFGATLARMHQQPQSGFGWSKNNYIGSLTQLNTPQHSWAEFYTICRIIPLVKILVDSHVFSETDSRHSDSLCKQVGSLFPNEPPSLLHGDLWAGNFMIGTNSDAVVYDPAVYCGHREMDLGMTQLFGGFNQSFYEGYEAIYPLAKGWQHRLPLTQLYPLLVHAVLFGGHYVQSVRNVLSQF